jgi:hypothetical protein
VFDIAREVGTDAVLFAFAGGHVGDRVDVEVKYLGKPFTAFANFFLSDEFFAVLLVLASLYLIF